MHPSSGMAAPQKGPLNSGTPRIDNSSQHCGRTLDVLFRRDLQAYLALFGWLSGQPDTLTSHIAANRMLVNAKEYMYKKY